MSVSIEISCIQVKVVAGELRHQLRQEHLSRALFGILREGVAVEECTWLLRVRVQVEREGNALE